MGKPREPSTASLRDRLIGLGEQSHRKSYYPVLRERLIDLERFRALLDESQDGILLVDLSNGIVTDINEAGRRFVGLSESICPGVALSELVPPAARAQVTERLEARETGASTPFIVVVPSPEGERFLEMAVRSKGSFEGRAFAVLVIRDATERIRAEVALKDSEERYRNLFESSVDAIVAVDLEGRFTDANPAALRLLGYSREELLALSYPAITPERWHNMNEAVLAQVPEVGYSDEYEKEYVRKDGSTIPISVRAFTKKDFAGNRAGTWAIVRDMTERKRAEEALRESEERFRAAFQTSLDAISISRVDDGVFVAVNEGFQQLLGWSEGEVIGRSSLELHVWDDPADRARMMQALRSVGYAHNLEAAFCTKNGTVLRGLMSAQLIRLRRQEYLLTITRNVTEWKRAEAERDRLKSVLHQAAKMEAIGQLAGGIAHDFNNLLTVILAGTEALKSDFSAGMVANPEVIEEIGAAGDRARDLTRQLLAFSRRQVIAPVPFDLNSSLRGSEKLLRRVLGEDVELVVELQPALWTVRCDPTQIDQVMLNLAVNARDAMPRGGKLKIQTANVEVDERLTASRAWMQPGSYVRLAIRDSGEGMSPEVKAHLFEPFFTTKPVGKGTGLGLATVYGIVKQSGGYVLVDSDSGAGTTFEIFLPRMCGPQAEASPHVRPSGPRPGPGAQRGTETVLVVEDDPYVREVTGRSLRSAGYQVLVASAAQEALDVAAAAKGRLHLLVSDVVMPGLDVRVMASELQKRNPGLRVLYVSGHTEEVIVKRGALEPGIEFLQKPFTASTLWARVREILDK